MSHLLSSSMLRPRLRANQASTSSVAGKHQRVLALCGMIQVVGGSGMVPGRHTSQHQEEQQHAQR
jgi:hypothetical protein